MGYSLLYLHERLAQSNAKPLSFRGTDTLHLDLTQPEIFYKEDWPKINTEDVQM